MLTNAGDGGPWRIR